MSRSTPPRELLPSDLVFTSDADILELRKKRNQSGIKHLRRAIVNDPDLKQAYHALYQAYARVRNKKAMSELRANYYDRFGVPLPTK